MQKIDETLPPPKLMNSQISCNNEFSDYLDSFRATLINVFYERDNIEKFTQKRGFPALVLREIMAGQPLSVAIPIEYGGRGVHVHECLSILEAASYESLPLSLTFGINIALFLEPVGKYGQESVKKGIFDRFLHKQNMGGLMITEPDYGSDALNMQTSHEKIGSKYHIQGIKHWQGLTGLADYWLMTCRAKKDNGELGRDLDFFICDEQQPEQRIIVEEYFNNIGLYPIPYGRNKVDIKVPEEFRLIPETTGLKLMMDLLHRSRLQFPGMATGFLRRMMEESLQQCTTRYVSGKPLIALDHIKHQIANLQSAFTVSSAMCSRSVEISSITNNVAGDGIEANSMKAYITDLMHYSAQTLTQLCGAKGYKEEHLGARGIVDSRPFQIFEGTNEMLYSQISEMVLKLMGRKKISNLSEFLKDFSLTDKAISYFKSLLNFSVESGISQRKNVDLGKILSRIISANMVINLGAKGFRQDLVTNCIESIKHDISTLVCSFSHHSGVDPLEDYHDNSRWLAFSKSIPNMGMAEI